MASWRHGVYVISHQRPAVCDRMLTVSYCALRAFDFRIMMYAKQNAHAACRWVCGLSASQLLHARRISHSTRLSMNASSVVVAVVAVAAAAVVLVGAMPAGGQSSRPGRASTTSHGRGQPVLIDQNQWYQEAANLWVRRTDGAKYVGDVIRQADGGGVVPHGVGKCTIPGVVSYTGSWRNGYQHGNGGLVSDGSRPFAYHGMFKDGLPFGSGVFSSGSEGWRYQGHFVNNKRHGYGVLADCEGQLLKGQWRLGRLDGHGKVLLSDGRTLEGEFSEWDPRINVLEGSFRGKVTDIAGLQITQLNRNTSKSDIVNARNVVRKRHRADDVDGDSTGEPWLTL